MEPNDTPDLVNHPPHYKAGGIEVIDFIEAKGLNYRLGNVVKYVARAGLKGATLQDLRKARWYLDREIFAQEASEATLGILRGIGRQIDQSLGHQSLVAPVSQGTSFARPRGTE